MSRRRCKGRDQAALPADPVGEHRATELDALRGEHLCLPIQREVVRVPRHQDMRDRRLGRHATLDQAGGRGLLQDNTRAGPAGQLRAPGHEHPELGGDHVQPPSPNAVHFEILIAAR